MEETVLDVRNLSIAFRQYGKGLAQRELQAIRDLSVRVSASEMVAVVGASGSGKSLLAHGVLGILPGNARVSGEMRYRDEPLTPQRQRQLRGREIALVPQSVAYLDPLMKIGPQISGGRRDAITKDRTARALERYGLDAQVERLYPFELSGGMARRVLISTAVAISPRLVIADEPTPGLHEEVARRVLAHFREMADEGAAVLLITHDLELALETADRIAVFYAGTTIEDAAAADFSQEERLRHPYTRALWRAMPRNGFQAIGGTQPYAGEMPDGCPFRPRCPMAKDICKEPVPYRKQRGGHVRCVLEGG